MKWTQRGVCGSCGRVMSLLPMTGMINRHGMGTGMGSITCPGSKQPPSLTPPNEPTQRTHPRRSQ